jgi:xylose dehydrogenase (NAD/NADP)
VTDRILRWGLLSTAHINKALITPLRASPRNRLTAVASRDLAHAQAYAADWGIPRTFGSYEAMLADPDIDVVYISLPNSLHAGWTIKAAQAGKHVLCEKPLAISLEEVDAVAEAAAKAGVVVAEAFMYRHHPQTLKVIEMVDGGVIGRLQVIRGAFTFPLTNPANIRLAPALGGGGIWDVGCYPISYTRTIAGAAPSEVFGWQETGESGVDVVFAGQMRFPGGVLGQFDSGFRGPERMLMEFVGNAGMLSLTNAFKPGLNAQIALQRDDGTTALITVPGQELYIGEVEDMADAILLGKPQRITLADSRANVATILALLKSARQGKPITLSLE